MDALELARAQFGLNIAFHILFPTLSIGLAWVIVFLRTRMHLAGSLASRERAQELSDFLIKIFAITFALGAASGIVMSFQFGTNWPEFMNTVGAVAGPLLSYEILSAFFLEATFLGILLFGKNKVSPWVRTLSAWIVALGTTLSAFWILSLNSWMHTPAGHGFDNGELVVLDWMAVVFNPSFPYRLAHMLTACLLTATFFCLGLFAYKHLKTGEPIWTRFIKKCAPYALGLAIAQAIIGDLHGINTLEHQPAKVAAIEGVWNDTQGAPLLLFALPDEESKSNKYEIGIPGLASFILTHDFKGEIKGLNSFEDRPDKVATVFWSFRIMVGVGLLMIALAGVGTVLTRVMKKAVLPLWYYRALVGSTFSGWIAVLAGWIVTEVGRQPWLVTGILKTKDAAGHVSLAQIQTSFLSYSVVYAICLIAYIWAVYALMRHLHLSSSEGSS